MPGIFVYVISGDHGRQKIGVSDAPLQRLRDLQTGSPFPLKFEFVGQTDGTGYDVEGEAHFLLHEHRQSGEWFTVPPEVAITAVMASARRLGHTIKPVDPDNLPASSTSLPVVPIPNWAMYTSGGVVFAAAMIYTMVTDTPTESHYLTALIVSSIAMLIIKAALKRLAPIIPQQFPGL